MDLHGAESVSNRFRWATRNGKLMESPRVPWVLLPQAVALSVFDAFVGN